MKVKTASPDNFSKFGRVVKSPAGEPTSQAQDYKFWSDIADYNINGSTEIGICVVYRQGKNIIDGMERHLNTPEILIPIDSPFVLPVLKEGENENSAEAFRVDIGEAIIIDNGIWHGACLPDGKNTASYFVIFRKGTPFEDVQKKSIAPVEIEI